MLRVVLTIIRKNWLFCSLILILALMISCTSSAAENTAPPSTHDDEETTVAEISEGTPTFVATESTLMPCSSIETISMLMTPVPVTLSPPPPTAANQTVPPPTATPRPAPTEDRVGFPEGYRDDFFLFYVFERMDNKQVRVICGNEVATQIIQGDKSGFPHGSILVMETWRAAVDA